MRPEITGRKILPIDERFGVNVGTAAAYAGISKTRVYELLRDGELAGRIIRGRRIVEVRGARGLLHLCRKAPSAKRSEESEESISP